MNELQNLQATLKAANDAYDAKAVDCNEQTDFAEEIAAIKKAEVALDEYLSSK